MDSNFFKISITSLCCILILASACTEDECQDGMCDPDQITLLGKWQLDKECFSDGASSCGEENLKTPEYTEIIQFNLDGTINITRDGVMCTGTYGYDGKESLNLQATDTNCNFDNTTYRVYDLTDNSVTINPPCREACIKKYVRM